MPANELELKLTWENNINFTLTAKRDAGSVKVVVSIDENGNIGTLFPHVEQLCKDYFTLQIADIATTMKS